MVGKTRQSKRRKFPTNNRSSGHYHHDSSRWKWGSMQVNSMQYKQGFLNIQIRGGICIQKHFEGTSHFARNCASGNCWQLQIPSRSTNITETRGFWARLFWIWCRQKCNTDFKYFFSIIRQIQNQRHIFSIRLRFLFIHGKFNSHPSCSKCYVNWNVLKQPLSVSYKTDNFFFYIYHTLNVLWNEKGKQRGEHLNYSVLFAYDW